MPSLWLWSWGRESPRRCHRWCLIHPCSIKSEVESSFKNPWMILERSMKHPWFILWYILASSLRHPYSFCMHPCKILEAYWCTFEVSLNHPRNIPTVFLKHTCCIYILVTIILLWYIGSLNNLQADNYMIKIISWSQITSEDRLTTIRMFYSVAKKWLMPHLFFLKFHCHGAKIYQKLHL